MEFMNMSKEVQRMSKGMKEEVGYIKVRKGDGKELVRLADEVSRALVEVEGKWNGHSIPQASKDILNRYMPKVKKYFEEAQTFIEGNIKVGSIKKYDTSKNSKDSLDKLKAGLKSAKETLLAAINENYVDPAVCATPIPSSVGIEKHIESMHLAVQTESYIQALHLGRQILQKLPYDAAKTRAVINYNMACIYAMLGNTLNVVAHLQNARAFGFADFKQLDEDRDFDNIRFQLEFTTFRQMMEYEVLQTERWREMSEEMVHGLTALFDMHDTEGEGTLSFSQFESLCKAAFQITSTAQVMAFWRETCEDTIEAMHLFEFLNFMAEHKDVRTLLPSDVAHSPRSSHNSHNYSYNGFAPIHTSSLFSPSSPSRSPSLSPSLYFPSSPPSPPSPNLCFPAFSYSVEGQAWGFGGDMARNNGNRAIQVSDYDSPFSYYTTSDPFEKFRL